MTTAVAIDIHMHSTASDGLSPAAEVVSAAARAGLALISLTDHDTLDAFPEAVEAGERLGVRVVPGVEISAALDGTGVHILGYLFDPSSPALIAFLEGRRRERQERMLRMVDLLNVEGVRVEPEEVAREAAGGMEGRPHLARVLLRHGQVRSFQDAFRRWLGKGCPAYVPAATCAASQVIDVVHRAGGVTSFAHPGLERMDAWIPTLVAEGLDALEAWHSDHEPAQVERYRALAADHGLACTGGSDYHGRAGQGPREAGRGRQLGQVRLPMEVYEALERAARRRREGTGGAASST